MVIFRRRKKWYAYMLIYAITSSVLMTFSSLFVNTCRIVCKGWLAPLVSAQNSAIQKCQRAKLPHKVCSRVAGYVYACGMFLYTRQH